MIPIRCFTCNTILAKREIIKDLKEDPKKCFENHKLKYCCRMILLTMTNMNEIISR